MVCTPIKILMDSVDALITPMGLTSDAMNTQFHDKVDSKTLEFNNKSCRLETYENYYRLL